MFCTGWLGHNKYIRKSYIMYLFMCCGRSAKKTTELHNAVCNQVVFNLHKGLGEYISQLVLCQYVCHLHIAPDCTHLRMKWCCMLMCLVHMWCMGFCKMCIDAVVVFVYGEWCMEYIA